MREILKSPDCNLMLTNLRVCWENILSRRVPYNCSQCQKCIRTQLTLEALGVKNPPTFTGIDPDSLEALTIVEHVQKEWQDLYHLLKNKKSTDPKIIAALWKLLQKPLRR